MKDVYQVLSQKERDIERVRKEIEALHFVIPLLAAGSNMDWLRHAPPRSFEGLDSGRARMATKGTPADPLILLTSEYSRAHNSPASARGCACHFITDRLLGGGRYDKFVKTCEQRYKQALANLEENTRKLQEADEQLFNLRVLEQAFKNPNFVATNHPHQDR